MFGDWGEHIDFLVMLKTKLPFRIKDSLLIVFGAAVLNGFQY